MEIDNTNLPIISSDNVEGTKVFNANGDKLGTIETVMIDKTSGQVRYAVLEFGGFLGMGTDRYPLPWDVLAYSPKMGGYVVPLEKQQIENAPRYPKGDAPQYTPTYGRSIYDYYDTPWYM